MEKFNPTQLRPGYNYNKLQSINFNNNKKENIMKTKYVKLFSLFLIAFISFLSTGCGSSSTDPTPCSTTGTYFQAIYSNTATAAGNTDMVTYDSEIHEYSFRLSANKTVCSVGYQSQPAISSLPYTIELRDSTTHTTVFNISSTFSSSATSYVSVPSNPVLTTGHVYTLKRIITSYGGLITNTVGRMAISTSFTPLSFPTSSGDMSIIGSKYYQNATAVTDLGIPFIDIVFK